MVASLVVAFVLLVLAVVALIFGYVTQSLPLDYISIAVSAIALLLVVVFSRPKPASSYADGGPFAAEEDDEEVEAVLPLRTSSVRPVSAAETVAVPVVENGSPSGGETFPIPGYDSMTVDEILDRLETLDDEDLETVRDYEEAHRNRADIVDQIDDILGFFGPAEDEEELGGAGDDLVTIGPHSSATEDAWTDDEDDDEELDRPGEEPPESETGGSVVTSFPIPDYDRLRSVEILTALEDLEPSELLVVAEREAEGARRVTVLRRLENLLARHGQSMPSTSYGESSTASIPATRTPTTKKAPAAKAPAAKKATAATTSAAKKATPAKSPATRKSPAKAADTPPVGAASLAAKRAAAKAPAAKKATAATTSAAKKATPAKSPATRKSPAKAADTPPVGAASLAAKRAAAKAPAAKKATAATTSAAKKATPAKSPATKKSPAKAADTPPVGAASLAAKRAAAKKAVTPES